MSKFTALDLEDLLLNAEGILNTRVRHEDDAWRSWAEQSPPQSAKEWHELWNTVVKSIFLDLEGRPMREKIYKKAWETWLRANPRPLVGSAEEWHAVYEQKVKPRFEYENENSQGISTPVKTEAKQIFRNYEKESPTSARNRSSLSASMRQSTKRDRPYTNQDEEEEDLYESPLTTRKRARHEEVKPSDLALPFNVDENVVEDHNSDASEAQDRDEHGEEHVNDDEDEAPPNSSPPTLPKTALQSLQNNLETQEIVHVETQYFDFEEPEAEEELGDQQETYSDDGEESEDMFETAPDFIEPKSRSRRRLASQTSTPRSAEEDESFTHVDVEDPPPAENDEDTLFVTAPDEQGRFDSQSSQYSEVRSLEDRIAALGGIRNLMAEGHDQKDILMAVKMTSAHPALFSLVLDAIEDGDRIPSLAGIWTKQEDIALQSGDARAIQRLEHKHGWDGVKGCEGRLEFLQSFNQ